MPWAKTTKLTLRKAITFAASSGSKHRWKYDVTFSLFTKNYAQVYAEFKVMKLHINYIPNNPTTETGLYVSVIADKDGFGGFGAAAATSWFPTLCAFPGSKVRPRYVGVTHNWRPTEPSEREWVKGDASDFDLCTVYTCSNGLETDELGGMLLISATVLARGTHYNAVQRSLEDDVLVGQYIVDCPVPLDLDDLVIE